MLKILNVDSKENLFIELTKQQFEPVVKGRSSAVVVEPFEGKIPVIRTSTTYNNPAQRFRDVHRDIIRYLNSDSKKYKEDNRINEQKKYNNAMIEIYDERYKKMGFHSDQVFDVEENSNILTYSCYEDPDKPNRMFVFCDKQHKKERSVVLQHDSLLIMPWNFNQNYLHKIVMIQKIDTDKNNKYVSITYRKSKTFIDPKNPHIHKANNEEKKEFYKLCGIQNNEIDPKIPEFNYAISTAEFSLDP